MPSISYEMVSDQEMENKQSQSEENNSNQYVNRIIFEKLSKDKWRTYANGFIPDIAGFVYCPNNNFEPATFIDWHLKWALCLNKHGGFSGWFRFINNSYLVMVQ